MDRPYSISDFEFPNPWDRDEGPDLLKRAGRGSRTDRELGRGESGKGSDSSHQRRFDRSRTIYRGRERDYSLRNSEVRTLTDLAKFRVVPEDDLARFGYQGSSDQMQSDIRIRTTMNIYTQAVPRAVREANRKVVRNILGKQGGVEAATRVLDTSKSFQISPTPSA